MYSVYKISDQYIHNDCVQLMIGYRNNLTIFNKKGIIFHDVVNKPRGYYVNKYIEDDRRYSFPYGNIPIHLSEKGLIFKKQFKEVNQIFNIDESYLKICDGVISFINVTRKDDGVYVICNCNLQQLENVREKMINFNELRDYFGIRNFYLFNDGTVKHMCRFQREEDTYLEIKKFINSSIYDYVNDLSLITNVDHWFLDYINSLSDKDDLSSIDYNIDFEQFYRIIADGNDIMLQKMLVTFVKKDFFNISIYDYFYDRTLKIDDKTKINMIKDHHISLRLNPHIDKSDIDKAKIMVRRKYMKF